MAALIDLPPASPLWARHQALTPLVIDIGAYEAADLQRRPSLAARLFELEQLRDLERVEVLAVALVS